MSDTHPSAIFSLVPMNDRAWTTLKHSDNTHLVSLVRKPKSKDFVEGLDIGPFIGSKSRYTLATIGRCGDVVVEGAGISRVQCSFELDENTREVMLQDRSSNRSTQFFGPSAKRFEPGRAHRRVVVDKNTNLEFGFGGTACDLFQFRLVWYKQKVLGNDLRVECRENHPRHTRTVLEAAPEAAPTAAPSRPITRIHTPGILDRIRYSRRKVLGSGSYGEVWKVANVDTGEHLALKRVKRPAFMSSDHLLLKREVETLSRLSHQNIIEYRIAQWADTQEHMEIFMELKPGNIEDLIKEDLYVRHPKAAEPLLLQMLQALDYLASKDIIHRDVKPANILYTPLPENGSYLYQLADFGLSNLACDARTYAGTGPYMAPELSDCLLGPQTTKMDIWSLLVTLAYAMNVSGFRSKLFLTTPLRIKAVEEAVNGSVLQPLEGMAKVDPKERATAGDMLDKVFGGEGRSTLREEHRPAAPQKKHGVQDTQQGKLPEPASNKKSLGDTVETVEQGSQEATEAATKGRHAKLLARRKAKKQATRHLIEDRPIRS